MSAVISRALFVRLARRGRDIDREKAKTRLTGLLRGSLGSQNRYASFYKFIGDLLSNNLKNEIMWELGWNGKLSFSQLSTLKGSFEPIGDPLYYIVQAINCNDVQQLSKYLEDDKYAEYRGMLSAVTWLYTCALHKAGVAEVDKVIKYIGDKGITVEFVSQNNGDLRIADSHFNQQLREAFQLILSSNFITYPDPRLVNIPKEWVREFQELTGAPVISDDLDIASESAVVEPILPVVLNEVVPAKPKKKLRQILFSKVIDRTKGLLYYTQINTRRSSKDKNVYMNKAIAYTKKLQILCQDRYADVSSYVHKIGKGSLPHMLCSIKNDFYLTFGCLYQQLSDEINSANLKTKDASMKSAIIKIACTCKNKLQNHMDLLCSSKNNFI